MLSPTLNSDLTEEKTWRQVNRDENISFISDKGYTEGSDGDDGHAIISDTLIW